MEPECWSNQNASTNLWGPGGGSMYHKTGIERYRLGHRAGMGNVRVLPLNSHG